MERKLIEWTLDDVMGELRRISLVSTPAIEEEFMLFSNGLMKFQTINGEKRIITGASMIPNIQIPRKDENGELYYGFFSEETIQKAAELFFKKGSNTNLTNLEHQFEVDGVHFFESWIIEDPNNDKSKALGFNYPKGTWMVSAKVENDVVWENYIKTGLIRGFSVEVRADEKDVEILSKINDILDSDKSVNDKWESIITILSKS